MSAQQGAHETGTSGMGSRSAWGEGTHEELCGIAGIAGCATGLITLWLMAMVLRFGLATALVLGVVALLGAFHLVSTRLIDGRWITLGDMVDGSKRLMRGAAQWTGSTIRASGLRERPVHVLSGAAAIVVISLIGVRQILQTDSYDSPRAYIEQRGRELGTDKVSESFQATVGETRAAWLIWSLPDGSKLGELTTVDKDGRTKVVGDTEHVPKDYRGINPREIFGQGF